MTSGNAAMTWLEHLMAIASATLRGLALITIATLLIFVLLPGALDAAGPQVPIGN